MHTWTRAGVYTIPLNIGYVGSYLKKKIGEDNIEANIRLFKDANKLVDAIEKEKPDVVALGFFVWNEKLNKHVFDHVKENYPKILTIGGGPRFTNINANQEGAEIFFKDNTTCDIFVVNQGEKGFYKVVKKFCDLDFDVKKIKSTSIPGSLVNNLDKNKIHINNCKEHIHVGENIGALEDLNDIPSPYLNGMLDEFFEDRWIPILETNRSCPYRCTFCAWGIGTQKLLRFDESRVNDEIEYIAERCKKSKTLFIADANFSILERDAVFAKKMYETHLKHGWPYNVAVQWNKTRPDRVLNVAKEFKTIAPVGASMQSLDNDVLSAVKRKNLTFDQILSLQNSLKEIGIDEKSFTELILGLPLETRESHIFANKKLVDHGFEIWNYFLHLLPGTEMDKKEYREKYFKKTCYRLHDNSYGIYQGKKIFELQETVNETTTMSEKDFKYFRFFHFLMQMMWSKKWFYYFLIFLKNVHQIHPVDFIQKVAENISLESTKIKEIYDEFMTDYSDAELFASEDDLRKYWSKKENFERLRNGEYGKLNMLYTYKVILIYNNEFSDYLLKICKEFEISRNIQEGNFIEKCRELLKFQTSKFVKFKDENSVVANFKEMFEYDILNFIDGDFNELNKSDKKLHYKFFMPENKKVALDTQLSNNKSKNLNSKLRDMTVYTSTNQFFYDVEELTS